MSTRHELWLAATYICDFAVVPPFSARTLRELAPGEVRFRAERSDGLADQLELVTLDVSELWLPRPDPLGNRRLESEGCHISALRWHV